MIANNYYIHESLHYAKLKNHFWKLVARPANLLDVVLTWVFVGGAVLVVEI